jgi:hypothetical protein
VSKVAPADVARLSRHVKLCGLSDSSRAKHLRALGACFASAVERGIAAQNPVRRLPRAERPRPIRKESAYFAQDELPLLFAQIPEGQYRTLFLLALKTGMRRRTTSVATWTSPPTSWSCSAGGGANATSPLTPHAAWAT